MKNHPKMKGIILAGGSGTRLHPATKVISKQLLAVYDKPMVYYPLCTLMEAGIKEILIISTPQDIKRYEDLLRDGSQWGMHFDYVVQDKPNGLAEAFILGESFIGKSNCTLILGDNIFFGEKIVSSLKSAVIHHQGGLIFAYEVRNPRRFGVVEFDRNNSVIGIEEKPDKPKSRYAVTGLYVYDNKVIEVAKSLKPSKRGEIEITDIHNIYLQNNKLKVVAIGKANAWLDMGTFDSLLSASSFIQTIEKREGIKIGCPEEIAYLNKFIDAKQLHGLIKQMKKNPYRQYLKELIEEGVHQF